MVDFIKAIDRCIDRGELYTGYYFDHGMEWKTNTTELRKLSVALKKIIIKEESHKIRNNHLDLRCVDDFIAAIYKYLQEYDIRHINPKLSNYNIGSAPGVTLFV